jgi:hypothetical protein
MFWNFNLSFDILATVLATFPNIGLIFVHFSGHSGYDKWGIHTMPNDIITMIEQVACNK